MRHAKPYRKLSRQRSHYRALMRNLTFSLIQHESIQTTLAKAKEVRPFVDKIITLGKEGSLHARRRAFSLLGNKTATAGGERVDVVGKVFTDLAGRLKAHTGGYTRIIKLGRRPGDAAPMAILQLVQLKAKAAKKGDSEADAEAKEVKAPKKAKAPRAKKSTEEKVAAKKKPAAKAKKAKDEADEG